MTSIPLTFTDLRTVLDRNTPVLIPLVSFDAAQIRSTCQDPRSLLFVEISATTMADVYEALRPDVERLIERLVQASQLIIEDDFQELLDLGLYNARLGSLFEALWTARFECREQRDHTPAVAGLCRSTFEDPSPFIKTDALLFWLTLMRQNDSVSTRHVILALRCAEGFDQDMWTFIRAAEHWESLGSPLRIVTDIKSIS